MAKDINSPPKDYNKRELLNICDRYTKITNTWACYTEDPIKAPRPKNPPQRPAATIPVPAEAGKNTRNAAWEEVNKSGLSSQLVKPDPSNS